MQRTYVNTICRKNKRAQLQVSDNAQMYIFIVKKTNFLNHIITCNNIQYMCKHN